MHPTPKEIFKNGKDLVIESIICPRNVNAGEHALCDVYNINKINHNFDQVFAEVDRTFVSRIDEKYIDDYAINDETMLNPVSAVYSQKYGNGYSISILAKVNIKKGQVIGSLIIKDMPI